MVEKAYLGEIVIQSEGFEVLAYDAERSLPISQTTHQPELEAGSFVKFYSRNGQAEIVELMATAQSAKAKIYKIAAKHNLDLFFQPEVLAELAWILSNPGIDDPSLTDYDSKPFCTIDGPGTRDLDQAMTIERIESGYRVYYAIADAAYYVKPESALFQEALKRGASYYLPELMVPMLPRELCEGVISLNEQALRRAVVFELNLDSDGQHLGTAITRARIRSRAKLSFEQVQTFLNAPAQSDLTDSELAPSLQLLKEVGLLRLRLAEERKVVRYHRTEINVQIGADGLVFNFFDAMRNDVELYNEQLSLLCNSGGARLLAEGAENGAITQAIFKVHAQPPEEKVAVFEQTIRRLIELHHLDPVVWAWDQNSPKALSDYLKELPRDGQYWGIAQAINRQAVVTNNRSMFSGQADQHYGVGAEVYARFSAPMREIVGIFLHKELLEKTGYQSQSASTSKEESLRDQVILMANRSKDLQKQLTKEANKLVMDQVFGADFTLPENQRPARKGVVIGFAKDKVYVLLDEPAIEIKVYLTYLQSHLGLPLEVDADQVALLRADDASLVACQGDCVEVILMDRNVKLDQWLFEMRTLKDSANSAKTRAIPTNDLMK